MDDNMFESQCEETLKINYFGVKKERVNISFSTPPITQSHGQNRPKSEGFKSLIHSLISYPIHKSLKIVSKY